MGLNSTKQKLIESSEIDDIVKASRFNLEKYYEDIIRGDNISFNQFKTFTFLNNDIAKYFYELLSYKGVMYYPEFKYFYALCVSSMISHKKILISLILFNNKEDITVDEYRLNVEKYMQNLPYMYYLKTDEFMKKFTRGNYCNRTSFVLFFNDDFIKTYLIIKKDVDTKDQRIPIDNEFQYCCKCQQNENNERNKNLDIDKEQRSIRDLYDRMESKFYSVERRNNNVYPISEFEKLMTEIDINPLLIKSIGSYLRKKTLNAFIHFEAFRDFLIRFTLRQEEKAMFLFEIFSYPNDSINTTLFKDFLPDQYPQTNITKEAFIKLYEEEDSFKVIISSMSKINAIPYLYFNITPKEEKYKHITLQIILKGLDIHEYLLKNIIDEDIFYCIEAAFIRKHKDLFLKSQSEADNEVDSESSIQKVESLTDSLVVKPKVLNRNLVYQKDYYICPERLCYIIKDWFKYEGPIIAIKKLVYDEKPLSESLLSYYDNKQQLIQIDNGKVYEIELYLIYTIVFSLKDFFDSLKNEEVITTIESLKEKLNTIKECPNDQNFCLYHLSYTRKKTFAQIKNTVNMKRSNLWIYNTNNNNLYMPNLDNTFEDEGIVHSCIIIIDSLKDYKQEIYYMDQFNENKALTTEDQKKEDIQKKNNESASNTIESEMPSDTINKDESAKKDNQQEINKKDDESETTIENKASKDNKNNEKHEETKENKIDDNKDTSQNQSTISSSIISQEKRSPLGIGNIGNSCYMNSVLQIIINLPVLKDILLHPNIHQFINRKRKACNNGYFIQELIKIIDSRWEKDQDKTINIINPREFKGYAGLIRPQFDNRDQQDANEFMTFLLDEANEELNIKSTKQYIINPDQGNKTQEELSNICWANAMRRSTSFINALFQFQLKSQLTCNQCNHTKISYESSSNLFLPIPVHPTILLKITLIPLPFEYKAYYHSINPKFKEYFEASAESNKSLHDILKEYHSQGIEEDEKQYTISLPIVFDFDVQRKWTIEEMLQKIRVIEELQLENITLDLKTENNNYAIYNVHECTYLAVRTITKRFYNHKLKIDSCFQDGAELYIYELLNANGINKLNQTFTETSLPNTNHQLISFSIKCDLKTFEEQKPYDMTNNIRNIDTNIAYYSKEPIKESPLTEFILLIRHYKQKHEQLHLFNKVSFEILSLKDDHLIVNNSLQNITARFLYNYIWTKYKRFFKEPNKIQSELWWNNNNTKICYPFYLKWSKLFESYKNALYCSKCHYLRYCSGCIIDPSYSGNLWFDSDNIIAVVWCSGFIEKELMLNTTSYTLTKWNLIPKEIEDDSPKTLDDCLNLFLEKENLDDKMTCDECKKLQYFSKRFEIDKAPYVLVVSLNRFKYVVMYNKKIETMIKFPMTDFTVKEKVYDLYGVVYHSGAMNYGHYTAAVKIDNKWMYFNDDRYGEIREEQVMRSEAYILVYLARDDIHNWDYYKMMMSIINQLKRDSDANKTKDVYYPEWTYGQPVITSLGEGYFMEDNSNGIKVHLNKDGEALFKNGVTQQTMLIPSKFSMQAKSNYSNSNSTSTTNAIKKNNNNQNLQSRIGPVVKQIKGLAPQECLIF